MSKSADKHAMSKSVRESPGVRDVLTFADLGPVTDIGAVFPGDPLLVDEQIEFFGQAVFAVAARSHRQARAAVLAAHMEYDEQAPLLDVAEACKVNCMLVGRSTFILKARWLELILRKTVASPCIPATRTPLKPST